MMQIDIAKDFSPTPGGRYIKDGPFSGEEFRKKLLKDAYLNAVEQKEKLTVIFDGCMGFPSSFIDESFGELAKELKDFNILQNMIIVSRDEPCIKDDILRYINERKEGAKAIK